MYSWIDTKDPRAVAREVQTAYLSMVPGGDLLYVPRVFGWALDCFEGRHEDYLPVDTRYHDLEHTLQGTLCLARLLAARHRTGAAPVLTQELVEWALLAALLHDSGYLKTRDDSAGTGAKYTWIHVERSAEFARRLMQTKGYDATALRAVPNMIRCTGVNAELAQIPFASEGERVAGFALATADLLGQMAAKDYLDKLPALHLEFEEAVAHHPEMRSRVGSFSSAAELRQKTPEFWVRYVRPKLDRELDGLHRFLSDPYPDGPNPYVVRIEAHLARLGERPQGGTSLG